MSSVRRQSPVPPVVIAVFGPTASSKSALAERLADRLNGVLVSADSMQAYRGLPILTNQPERPTGLVGIWPLTHEGSVGEYAPLAHAAVDEAVAAGRPAIVVGGTGLYLRAAMTSLALPPAPDTALRLQMESLYAALGPDGAHARLARLDPAAAAGVHANDRRRVVRALELHELGSSLRPALNRLWGGPMRRPALVLGLEVSREELAHRIERRAVEMFERGAREEAERALRQPISRQARQTIGLREVEEELPTSMAVARVAARTRAYARRQRTWMRRVPELVSVDAERPPGRILDDVLEVARARQHLPARRAG